MSKLSAAGRHAMPQSEFALPGHRFPIEDADHARLALAMAVRAYNAGHISEAEEETVERKAEARLKR